MKARKLIIGQGAKPPTPAPVTVGTDRVPASRFNHRRHGVRLPHSARGAFFDGQVSTVIVPRPNSGLPYEIGALEPVRTAHNGPVLGYVEINGIAALDTSAVDEGTAQAAGFEDESGFYAHWRETRQGVEAPASTLPLAVVEPVWVVWFTATEDVPRIPAKRSEQGYVHTVGQGMHHEPEAPSEAEQTRMTEEAHEAFTRSWRERQDQWNAKTRAQRVADVEAHLRLAGGTAGRKELRTVDALLEKARRKQMRDEAA